MKNVYVNRLAYIFRLNSTKSRINKSICFKLPVCANMKWIKHMFKYFPFLIEIRMWIGALRISLCLHLHLNRYSIWIQLDVVSISSTFYLHKAQAQQKFLVSKLGESSEYILIRHHMDLFDDWTRVRVIAFVFIFIDTTWWIFGYFFTQPLINIYLISTIAETASIQCIE